MPPVGKYITTSEIDSPVSVAIGLHLNDQQRASSWGSPILFIGIITVAMEVVIDISPWVLPTGAAPELIGTLIFRNITAVSPSITAVIGWFTASLQQSH